MNMISIIEKKKAGLALNREEIEYFVKGATDGSIPDYQLSALLMAICFRGMNPKETVELTLTMERSGEMCDLSGIPGIKVDKHSTGGVGDTTTLIAEPLAAACGVYMAKMSGRGLGHTGGTLDKLESIPGMSISLTPGAFIRQVKESGMAVIGQTANLAPADKVLYALRDVTATVNSMPLIVSSILSKKLAGGADGIVLDVKTGNGALMKTDEESIELAKAMVQIGCDAGRKVVALVTDMNQPLGSYVGNALEVKDAIDVLSGRTKGALLEVSLALAAQILILAEKAETQEEAMRMLKLNLENGRGLDMLRKLIAAQGGDSRVCDDTALLPQAPVQWDVKAPEDGFIFSMDTVALGYLAQAMGAGRQKKTDVIDPSVGFLLRKRIGEPVKAGETIVTLYARNQENALQTEQGILSAIQISEECPKPIKLIHALITKDGVIQY